MVTSGIHSLDLGTVSLFIPQKSDGFQVRNSFVQLWEEKKLHLKNIMTQADEHGGLTETKHDQFLPSETRRDSWEFETSHPADKTERLLQRVDSPKSLKHMLSHQCRCSAKQKSIKKLFISCTKYKNTYISVASTHISLTLLSALLQDKL